MGTSEKLDLRKHDPDEQEYEDALAEIQAGSDRAAAILGTALLDHELGELLLVSMTAGSSGKSLLDNGGPLSSLANRTAVARAFGVITPTLARTIDTIRSIRNEFAHAPLSLSFDHPVIAARCSKFPQRTQEPTEIEAALAKVPFSKNRAAFEMACNLSIVELLRKSRSILQTNATLSSIYTKGFLDNLNEENP